MQNKPFNTKLWLAILAVIVLGIIVGWKHFSAFSSKTNGTTSSPENSDSKSEKAQSNPALTVQTVKPKKVHMSNTISANGNVQAWQEAIVGAEVSGLNIKEVFVNVGDSVKKGQALAKFSTDVLQAEQAQSAAALAEARASYAQAKSDADRARSIQDSGALSGQQIEQLFRSEDIAKAKLAAAEAGLNLQKIKLNQIVVTAPDDGVISSRTATIGSVANAGQELFRVIRQGRLEWRAEITSADISYIHKSDVVDVTLPDGKTIIGKVRAISPTIDTQSRNGIVYVDLPRTEAKSGMYARGSFDLSADEAITLPASAIILRDGFAYVMRVQPNNRIKQIKVKLGRHNKDLVEILNLNEINGNYVSAGGAFLADDDLVRLVDSQLNKISKQ